MKSRTALEAINGQKTIQEIASHYGVHPNQVTSWKKQASEGMPAVFAGVWGFGDSLRFESSGALGETS